MSSSCCALLLWVCISSHLLPLKYSYALRAFDNFIQIIRIYSPRNSADWATAIVVPAH